MFSNPRTSKNEFVGMIRNIFSNSKQSAKRNITAHQEYPRDKKSFRKKVKSKLSFMRVDSIKLGRDRSQKIKCSPELQRRFGRASATSNLKFEDMDQTFNLSSILKNPNTSRSSIKKSLRFVENTAAMECSSQNIVDVSSSKISVSTINADTIDNKSIESDEDYYRRMKEKILSKGKSVRISKPKRNMSLKLRNDVFEAAQVSTSSTILDHYYFTPENKSSMQNSRNDNIFGDINRCNPEGIGEDSKGNCEAFPNILLRKWQCDDDERCIELPGDSNDASSLMEIQHSDSRCNDFSQFFFSRDVDGSSASTERDQDKRKMTAAKRIKENRYDPMAMTQTCAVSLCREQSMDCGRMSWCSVSSC